MTAGKRHSGTGGCESIPVPLSHCPTVPLSGGTAIGLPGRPDREGPVAADPVPVLGHRVVAAEDQEAEEVPPDREAEGLQRLAEPDDVGRAGAIELDHVVAVPGDAGVVEERPFDRGE